MYKILKIRKSAFTHKVYVFTRSNTVSVI